MISSARIFQASDLYYHGRQVLEAARTGDACLRDKDGLSLLILPERRAFVWRNIAQAAANLATVDHGLHLAQPSLPLGAYGEWTRLRHLPTDDVSLFRDKIRQALIVAAHEESLTLPETTLQAWRLTTEQPTDPTRGPILLGRPSLDDFVEGQRSEISYQPGGVS